MDYVHRLLRAKQYLFRGSLLWGKRGEGQGLQMFNFLSLAIAEPVVLPSYSKADMI